MKKYFLTIAVVSLLLSLVSFAGRTQTLHIQDACTGASLDHWPVNSWCTTGPAYSAVDYTGPNGNVTLVPPASAGGCPRSFVVALNGAISVTNTGNIRYVTAPYVVDFKIKGSLVSTSSSFENLNYCTGAIPLQNMTTYTSSSLQYKVTVFNTINYSQSTVFAASSWSSTFPTDLKPLLPTIPDGKAYMVLLEVKNSCGNLKSKKGSLYYNIVGTPTADFKINGNVVPATCSAPLQIDDCGNTSIPFNNNSSVNSTQYQVELFKPSNTLNPCGTYTSKYSTGYVSTCPTDLRDPLSHVSGTITPGLWKVVLTTKNSCGIASIPKVGFINVSFTLSPFSVALKINTVGGTPCVGQTLPPTCIAGCYSGTLTIGDGIHPFTSYKIEFQEINCSTGTAIGSVISSPTVPVSYATQRTLGFNALTLNGNTGYFAAGCANGSLLSKCYKVKATIMNACGAGQQWSYFKFSNIPQSPMHGNDNGK